MLHVRFTKDVCPTRSQAIDKCCTIPAPYNNKYLYNVPTIIPSVYINKMHVRFTNDVCPTRSQAIDKCSTIPAPYKKYLQCTNHHSMFHSIFISTKLTVYRTLNWDCAEMNIISDEQVPLQLIELFVYWQVQNYQHCTIQY